MNITKAVITAAGRGQRTLPLQTLIDSDGTEKSVLSIIIEEVLRAGIEEICLVVQPGDERPYAEEAGHHAGRLHFVHQEKPLGYGHAIHCARDFVGNEPFLHLVGDHVYVSRESEGSACRLVKIAQAEACSVSAVQATRENLLPYYGAVGSQRVRDRADLYRVDTVIEKPTPTKAEQQLIVPGLRVGHYLCFFGMHVLTPAIFDILAQKIAAAGDKGGVTLAEALHELAQREQVLALEMHDWRYDLGVRYGLMTAQMALALNGQDRDEVLANLLALLAAREMGRNRK
ncbi:MAG: NTP transferase domain-containing protein [Ardenticatenaceae bacterium]|nr:NTP transferase domain-containing protein [Ardenticatenaceae bacterium]MCB9443513.1 NTP transferase domain-containing protein [Ardenticatenaceae bacterium]